MGTKAVIRIYVSVKALFWGFEKKETPEFSETKIVRGIK